MPSIGSSFLVHIKSTSFGELLINLQWERFGFGGLCHMRFRHFQYLELGIILAFVIKYLDLGAFAAIEFSGPICVDTNLYKEEHIV